MNWKFQCVLTTGRQENECSNHLKYLGSESGRGSDIFFVTSERESDSTQLIRSKTFGWICRMSEWYLLNSEWRQNRKICKYWEYVRHRFPILQVLCVFPPPPPLISNQSTSILYRLMCWLSGSLTCRLPIVMRSPSARRSRKFNHCWLIFGSS